MCAGRNDVGREHSLTAEMLYFFKPNLFSKRVEYAPKGCILQKKTLSTLEVLLLIFWKNSIEYNIPVKANY